MKLLTLNCHSWQEENQIEKIKYLAEVINEEDFDCVALQEVSQEIAGTGKITKGNYMSILLDNLNKIGKNKYDFAWDMSHIGYDKYEEGLGIITKHHIKEIESFYVSKSTDIHEYWSRKVIKVTLEIDGVKHDFFSCHLGWWNDDKDSFKAQADNLIKRIDENTKTFLMGDFNNNASIKGEGYDYLLNRNMYDTFYLAEEHDDGITVEGEIDGWGKSKEDKRLDLILCNRRAEVLKSKVIFNGINRKKVSDHYGVEIIIK